MAKQDCSDYQQRVIAKYYSQLDTIMLGKLQELVTELYLVDAPGKRDRLWQRVEKAMAKLKVPASIAEHILDKKDVEILAKNVQDWLKHGRRAT